MWYWYKTTLSHVCQIGVFKFCLEVSKACDVSWESMMPNELKDKGWKKKEEAIYKSAWLHWFFMRSCVSLIFYSFTPYSDIIRAICVFPTCWCWTPPLFCHLCLSPRLILYSCAQGHLCGTDSSSTSIDGRWAGLSYSFNFVPVKSYCSSDVLLL